MVQGELFREEVVSEYNKSKSQSFLSQYQLTLTLDKLLLGFIGIMVVFVLTYSFGVERGKRSAEKRLETLLPAHESTFNVSKTETISIDPHEEVVIEVPQSSSTIEPLGSPSTSAEQLENVSPHKGNLPLALPEKGKYTIQLVTYVKEHQAAEEINRLKIKGYDGFIIPSGPHYQVCVNYFNNASQARSILQQLRTSGRYSDAYVRPVVR